MAPKQPEGEPRWGGETLILSYMSGFALLFVYLPLALMAYDFFSSEPGLVSFILAIPILTILSLTGVHFGFRWRWPRPVLTLMAGVPLVPALYIVFIFLFA